MRKVIPYTTVEGAARALDNGGRFFNLFSRINDEVVDSSELSKAAGVYSASATAFLHFEMALMGLERPEKARVLSLLSPKLGTRYRAERPWLLKPSEVESVGRAGNAIITEGHPVLVEDRTRLSRFLVSVGTATLIPIFHEYDVYELFDSPDSRDRCVAVAVPHGALLPDTPTVRFGGLLKELQSKPDSGSQPSIYLEALYYTAIGAQS